MRTRHFALAILTTALAGCSGWSWWPFGSSPAPDRPWYPADASVYKCEGNKTLVVRYVDGGKAAMVMFPDREFRLDAARAATGAKYSNGRTDLYTQGDQAFLEEAGNRLFTDCSRAAK